MPGIFKQLRIVGRSSTVLVRQPTMLLYPIVLALVYVGIVALILGAPMLLFFRDTIIDMAIPVVSLLAHWPIPVVVGAALTYVVVGPALYMYIGTAYTHEVNELLYDRRPMPFEGLAVATRMLPKLVLLGVLYMVGFFASTYVTQYLTRNDALTTGTTIAFMSVANFLQPALVHHDGSLREVFTACVDTIADTWETATIQTVSLNGVGSALVFLGLGCVPLVLYGWNVGALDLTPLGALVLAVLAPFVGLYLAVLVTTAVGGIAWTALYIYAREGEMPARIGGSPDDLRQ